MTLRRSKKYWNKKVGGGIARPFYDDADIIFSHIKMSSTYTGFWARVERSSDNAVLDVDFLPNRLPDLVAANTFRGSDVLSIKWIYNQGTFIGTDPDNAAKNTTRIPLPGTQNSNSIIHDGTDWVRIGDWLALDNDIVGAANANIARYSYPYLESITDKNSMMFSVFKNPDVGPSSSWGSKCSESSGDVLRSNTHRSDNRSLPRAGYLYYPSTSVGVINNFRNPFGFHEQCTTTRNSTLNDLRYNGISSGTATQTTVFVAASFFSVEIFSEKVATNANDFNNKSRAKFQELILYKSFDATKRDNLEAEQTSFYGTA